MAFSVNRYEDLKEQPSPRIISSIYNTSCCWCNKEISRGGWVNKFQPQEFSGYIRQLVSRISCKKYIPIGVSILISSYLFTTDNYKKIKYEEVCIDCCGNTKYITRSGRVSVKPYNGPVKTIAGSGFSGCDQYDRDFNGYGETKYNVHPNSPDLKGFIVSDNELTSQHAVMDHFLPNGSDYEEEEEIISDWETSDDEDPNQPCWLYSDEED